MSERSKAKQYIVAGFVLATAAAAISSVISADHIVHAPGNWVVDGGPHVIAPGFSGEVAEVAVEKGDRVKHGDVLLSYDIQEVALVHGRTLVQLCQLYFQAARLRSALDGIELEPKKLASFRDAVECLDELPGLWEVELSQFAHEQYALTQLRDLNERSRGAIEEQLQSLGRRLQHLQALTESAEEMLQTQIKLRERGAGSDAQVSAARDQVTSRSAELEETHLAIASIEGAFVQNELVHAELTAGKSQLWSAELAKISPQIALLEREFEGLGWQMGRRTIHAPTNGVVTELNIHSTVGNHLPVGYPILTLIADDAEGVVLVQVPPNEHDKVYVGMTANVQFATQGSSERSMARVIRVAVDRAPVPPQEAPYYEVALVLEDAYEVQWGTPGTALLLVEKRSLLDYLLGWIRPLTSSAFREE